MQYYLETNNLLHNNQYGFRKKRGTTTALAVIYEKIAQTLASKEQCYIVLRNVAKAFDRVWHAGLKYKILNIGVQAIFEMLSYDFLDDRQAKIKVDDYIGPPMELECGVPQGSSLSPTLYIIYTRDLPEAGEGGIGLQV